MGFTKNLGQMVVGIEIIFFSDSVKHGKGYSTAKGSFLNQHDITVSDLNKVVKTLANKDTGIVHCFRLQGFNSKTLKPIRKVISINNVLNGEIY